VGDLTVDKSIPWSFFDGACQGLGHVCGLGYVLYLSESHFYTGKENLGSGTNNYGEFKALLFLLKSSLNKGLECLQVFGDSTLVVNWMNDELQVQNIGLLTVAMHMKDLAKSVLGDHFLSCFSGAQCTGRLPFQGGST
jgi:ribonuclease HI